MDYYYLDYLQKEIDMLELAVETLKQVPCFHETYEDSKVPYAPIELLEKEREMLLEKKKAIMGTTQKTFTFDYNFHQCPICETKTVEDRYEIHQRCPNGCVRYEVDPQAETVLARLFYDEKTGNGLDAYILTLYENGLQSYMERFATETQRFKQNIAYWRERGRYLDVLRELKENPQALRKRPLYAKHWRAEKRDKYPMEKEIGVVEWYMRWDFEEVQDGCIRIFNPDSNETMLYKRKEDLLHEREGYEEASIQEVLAKEIMWKCRYDIVQYYAKKARKPYARNDRTAARHYRLD